MAGLSSQNISIASTHTRLPAGVSSSSHTDKTTCVFCRCRSFAVPSDPHRPVFAFFSLLDCRHYACQSCALVNCDNAGRFIECPECLCISRLAQSGRQRRAASANDAADLQSRIAIDDGVSSVASRASRLRAPRSALKGQSGSDRKKRASSVQFPANPTASIVADDGTQTDGDGNRRAQSPLTQDAVGSIPMDPSLAQREQKERERQHRRSSPSAEKDIGLYSLAAPAARKEKRPLGPAVQATTRRAPEMPVLQTPEPKQEEISGKAVTEAEHEPSETREGGATDDAKEGDADAVVVAPPPPVEAEEEVAAPPEDIPMQHAPSEEEDVNESEELRAMETTALLSAILQGEEEGRDVICETESHRRRALSVAMEREWSDAYIRRGLEEEFDISPRTPAAVDLSDQVSVTSDEESVHKSRSRHRRPRSRSDAEADKVHESILYGVPPPLQDGHSAAAPTPAATTSETAVPAVSPTVTEAEVQAMEEKQRLYLLGRRMHLVQEQEAVEREGLESVEQALRAQLLDLSSEGAAALAAQQRAHEAHKREEAEALAREAQRKALADFEKQEASARDAVEHDEATERVWLASAERLERIVAANREADRLQNEKDMQRLHTEMQRLDAMLAAVEEDQEPEERRRIRQQEARARDNIVSELDDVLGSHLGDRAAAERDKQQQQIRRLQRSADSIEHDEEDARYEVREAERHARRTLQRKEAATAEAIASVDASRLSEVPTLNPSDASRLKASPADDAADSPDIAAQYHQQQDEIDNAMELLRIAQEQLAQETRTRIKAEADRMAAEEEAQRVRAEAEKRAEERIRQIREDAEKELESQLEAVRASSERQAANEALSAKLEEEERSYMLEAKLKSAERALAEAQQQNRDQLAAAADSGKGGAPDPEFLRQLREREMAKEEEVQEAQAQLREAQRRLNEEAKIRAKAEADRMAAEEEAQRARVEAEKRAEERVRQIREDAEKELESQLEAVRASSERRAANDALMLKLEEEERRHVLEAKLKSAERALEEARTRMNELSQTSSAATPSADAETRRQLREMELAKEDEVRAVQAQLRDAQRRLEEEERIRAKAEADRMAAEEEAQRARAESELRAEERVQRTRAQVTDDLTAQLEADREAIKRRAEHEATLRALENEEKQAMLESKLKAAQREAEEAKRAAELDVQRAKEEAAAALARTPSSTGIDASVLQQMRERELAKEEEVLRANARLREAERRLEEEAHIRAKAEADRRAAEEEATRLLEEAERNAQDRIRRVREQAERELETQLAFVRSENERRAAHETTLRALAEEEKRAVLEAKLQAAERALEDAQRRAQLDLQRAREEATIEGVAETARLERQAREREAAFEEKKHVEFMLRVAQRDKEREEAEARLHAIEERASESVQRAREESQQAIADAQARLEEQQRRQEEHVAALRDAQLKVHRAREEVREFDSQRTTPQTSPHMNRRGNSSFGNAAAPTSAEPGSVVALQGGTAMATSPIRPQHPLGDASHTPQSHSPETTMLAIAPPASQTSAVPVISESLLRNAIRDAVRELLDAQEGGRTLREQANERLHLSDRRYRRRLEDRDRAENDLVEAETTMSDAAGVVSPTHVSPGPEGEHSAMSGGSCFFDDSQNIGAQQPARELFKQRHAHPQRSVKQPLTYKPLTAGLPVGAGQSSAAPHQQLHYYATQRENSSPPHRSGTEEPAAVRAVAADPHACPACQQSDTTTPCWSCATKICRVCGPTSLRLCCSAHHREQLRHQARLEKLARRLARENDSEDKHAAVKSASDSSEVVQPAVEMATSPITRVPHTPPRADAHLGAPRRVASEAALSPSPRIDDDDASAAAATAAVVESPHIPASPASSAGVSRIDGGEDEEEGVRFIVRQQSRSSHGDGNHRSFPPSSASPASSSVGDYSHRHGEKKEHKPESESGEATRTPTTARVAAEDAEEPKTVKKVFDAFFVPFGDSKGEPKRRKPPTPCNHVPLDFSKPFKPVYKPKTASSFMPPKTKPMATAKRASLGYTRPTAAARASSGLRGRQPGDLNKPTAKPQSAQRRRQPSPHLYGNNNNNNDNIIHTNTAFARFNEPKKAPVPPAAFFSPEDDYAVRTPPPLQRSRQHRQPASRVPYVDQPSIHLEEEEQSPTDDLSLSGGPRRGRDAYYTAATPRAATTPREEGTKKKLVNPRQQQQQRKEDGAGRGDDPVASYSTSSSEQHRPADAGHKRHSPRAHYHDDVNDAHPRGGSARRRESEDRQPAAYMQQQPRRVTPQRDSSAPWGSQPQPLPRSTGMVSTPVYARQPQPQQQQQPGVSPRRGRGRAPPPQPFRSPQHQHQQPRGEFGSRPAPPTLEELDRRLRQLRGLDTEDDYRSSQQHRPAAAVDGVEPVVIVLDHGARKQPTPRARSSDLGPSALSPPWRTDFNASPVKPQWSIKQPRSPLYRPSASARAAGAGTDYYFD